MAKRDYKNEIIPPEVSSFFLKVWEVVKNIFSMIWQVLVFFGNIIVKILVGIYVLIKSIAFSLSALIASIALLIISLSLSVYFVSMGIGLNESEGFISLREEAMQVHREYYEQKKERWMSKLSSRDYTVAEMTEVSCKVDQDCTTPETYLMRSVCPYTSKCLQNKCAVVCPKPFSHPGAKEPAANQ